MADIHALLTRWQTAGVLDAGTAERIRAYESEQKRPAEHSSQRLGWQGVVALILGAILLACGVVLFVSAHWDEMGPGARLALVMAMVAVFHLAGGLVRTGYRGLSTALHAVGTVSTGAAIALVGQIFNIQEHWPGAILLWALAAVAGWILLQDEVQKLLTLLLVPAWLLSEFAFYANGYLGKDVYLGRLLMVWSVLYLTVFLGSKRKAMQWVLFATAAVAAVVGIAMMVEGFWTSWLGNQTFLPLGTRAWGWVLIAVLPLLFSVFKMRKSTVPVAVATGVAILLPWCAHIYTNHYDNGDYHDTYSRSEPTMLAHLLVAAFAVFLIWWGVRVVSRPLVNLGIVWFGLAVAWFYFSNVMDKMGRSLGLICLGILFLAGGWALEKMRRGLLAGMGSGASREAAQ
jgi:uncharacterized membrane protein